MGDAHGQLMMVNISTIWVLMRKLPNESKSQKVICLTCVRCLLCTSSRHEGVHCNFVILRYKGGFLVYIDVVFVTGRGGGGFHSLDRALTRGRGGMFRVIPALPRSGAHPHSFPGQGPVCYHLFLTGTRLGYGWGGGLSGDRGREC